MRFLLDENAHNNLLSFLKKLGHDVIFCPKGIKNGEVFKLAITKERIIISQDTDFSKPPYSSLEHHFGIILLRIPPNKVDLQKNAILNLLKKFSEYELKGRVILLISDKEFKIL
ncbi:DUF5615 family PIN-like protein [Candidatus Pacearchaeota archaeon]|nr:DUF5615 family PIN-like protein [Candidatus Pacearchaeota archaeon]